MGERPSRQVLDTTELLEVVLLGLENQTLLLSQRTNKKFRDVVKASSRLQKKLFFIQPTFEEVIDLGLIQDTTEVVSTDPDSVALYNPLLFLLSKERKRKYEDSRDGTSLQDTIAFESTIPRSGC